MVSCLYALSGICDLLSVYDQEYFGNGFIMSKAPSNATWKQHSSAFQRKIPLADELIFSNV